MSNHSLSNPTKILYTSKSTRLTKSRKVNADGANQLWIYFQHITIICFARFELPSAPSVLNAIIFIVFQSLETISSGIRALFQYVNLQLAKVNSFNISWLVKFRKHVRISWIYHALIFSAPYLEIFCQQENHLYSLCIAPSPFLLPCEGARGHFPSLAFAQEKRRKPHRDRTRPRSGCEYHTRSIYFWLGAQKKAFHPERAQNGFLRGEVRVELTKNDNGWAGW